MKKTNIKFEGIDSWNRPVFKRIDSNERFGSVDILFNYSDTEKEVLDKISEDDLLYFGNGFDCEPMGDQVNNLKIIKMNKYKIIFAPDSYVPEYDDVEANSSEEAIEKIMEENYSKSTKASKLTIKKRSLQQFNPSARRLIAVCGSVLAMNRPYGARR